MRSEDVAPPVEALGGASAALRAGTGVNAVPAAADVGDVGDVGENRTLCAYVRQADLTFHDDRIWTKDPLLDKKIKSSETLIFFLFGVFFYHVKRISCESIFRRSYSTLKITFYVQLRLLASTIRSTVSAR